MTAALHCAALHFFAPSLVQVPLAYWIGFHVLITALLVVDMLVLGGRGPLHFRTALLWTLFVAALAFAFAGFLLGTQGREPALAFISGYVVEASLSIDNLFVFILLFRAFGLTKPGSASPCAGACWGRSCCALSSSLWALPC